MRRIFKYPIIVDPGNSTPVTLPWNAEILSVRWQDGQPVLWAIVDPTNEPETRHFEVFFTGHEVPEGVERKFLDTLILANGLVLHVFERVNGPGAGLSPYGVRGLSENLGAMKEALRRLNEDRDA